LGQKLRIEQIGPQCAGLLDRGGLVRFALMVGFRCCQKPMAIEFKIKDLFKNIVASQKPEIDDMKALLAKEKRDSAE
jgi:hypothetical protein